jgi:GR25 family glycosyltransferase involved in LPS biosynthesis
MKLNSYFDHIYCLNLPECKDRADMMKSRAKDFDISFTFFPAVSGKIFGNIYERYSRSVARESSGAFLQTSISNPNYMACAISHLSIYRFALASGHKRILILEDDLLFNKDMDEIFDSSMREIPEDWKLLYLAWIPLTDDLMYWNYNIINDRFIGENTFKAKNLWSAMAYGIDHSMMNHMINRYNTCFDKEIDRIFVEEIQPNFPCYGIDPQLFCGYDNYSNNSERNDLIFTKSFDSRRAKATDYV